MLKLLKNTIVEWIKGHETPVKERVLWSSKDGQMVVVIDVPSPKKVERGADDEIDPRKGRLPFTRLTDEIQSAIESGDAIISQGDPWYFLANLKDKYVEEHEDERETAYKIIEGLVGTEPDIYFRQTRGSLVKNAENEFNVSRATIYKYLCNYWGRGMVRNALIPTYYNSGAPGETRVIPIQKVENVEENSCEDRESDNEEKRKKRGREPKLLKSMPEAEGINITVEIIECIEIAIRLCYNKGKSIVATHQWMCERFFNIGYDGKVPILKPQHLMPTYGQFYYWFKIKLDFVKSIICREGRRKYELTARPLLGNSTARAFGPGGIFQIDCTIADIYLVWALDRTRIIGRPVAYFCIDVFSRMIVGLYVALEGPSWESGRMALANAMTDKVEFCAKYGVEIDFNVWPCCYIPVEYLFDRGEFLSIPSDQIAANLGPILSNTTPYRGDWKGIVESNFGVCNEKVIKWTPGEVRKRAPGEKDHRLDAVLDINEFTALLIHYVIERNNTHRINTDIYPMGKDMISDGVEPIPIELWNWGIVNRSGHLREKTPDAIKLALMPQTEASVTERGIKANGMYYSCDLALKEQWFTKARRDKRWKIMASYDPRDIDQIYLIRGKDPLITCYRLADSDDENERFNGCCLEDVQEYIDLDAQNAKKHISVEMQGLARLNAKKDEIVSNAKRKTKIAKSDDSTSNTQKIKDIRKNRKAAAQMLREEEKRNTGRVNEGKADASAKVIKMSDPLKSSPLENLIPAKDRIFDLIKEIAESGNDEND
jgi:hypothetical protein